MADKYLVTVQAGDESMRGDPVRPDTQLIISRKFFSRLNTSADIRLAAQDATTRWQAIPAGAAGRMKRSRLVNTSCASGEI